MAVRAICQEHASILARVATEPGGELLLTAVQKCVEFVSSGHRRSVRYSCRKEKKKNCGRRSEGWSLSLEKSLKDLQEPSYRLFWDYCAWIFLSLSGVKLKC